MKLTATFLTLFAAVGLAGAWLCSPGGFTADESDPELSEFTEAMPVETLVLEAATSITRDRQFTGTLVAARRTRLAFERPARLESVSVDDGDYVQNGQVLATIDQRQLQNQLIQLQASRSQQAAVLAELKAGPRQETIAAARAELAAIAADADLQKATLTRVEDLFKREATSAQAIDEARLTWQAAAAQKDAAARKLDELEAGTRTEKVAAQEALVAGIDSQLEQLQLDISDSQLTAPFAGTVVKRMADEGDFLNPQQAVFELIESDQLEARVGVPTALLDQLTTMDYVVLAAGTANFTGKIKQIVPQVDVQTRTQTVVIAVDDAHPDQLADGQLVRMGVTEKRAIDGFRVPLTALASASRGLWSIYVVEQQDGFPDDVGILKARSVEVLHTDADFAIVRGTVYEGERIVAAGVHRVVPGQKVRVENQPEERPRS